MPKESLNEIENSDVNQDASKKGKPNNKKPQKKKSKKKQQMVLYCGIVLALLVVALLASILVSSEQVNVEQSMLQSQFRVETQSIEVSEPEVVLGPYDEAEMPMLLNAQYPLPEGYAPEYVNVGYGNGKEQTMEIRSGQAFIAMKEAAAADGITLTPFSASRSNEHQVKNYNASIQKYIAQGYSEQKAIEMTQQYFAVPGTSEHEAGFAIDIDSIEESFENTPAFAWLQEHCTEYGFILRYPKDTEEITGIAYEPWHYRYVGANHAKAITEAGITLEEYVLGSGAVSSTASAVQSGSVAYPEIG